MVQPAVHHRFDELSTREIRNALSVDSIVARIAGAFEQAKQAVPAAGSALGHALIQNRLGQIPGSLCDDYARAPFKLGLGPPLERSIRMQAALHGGRHMRYSLPDADLVVIDRDVLIRTALYVYFSVFARSSANAVFAQAFVLVHGAVYRSAPLPLQYSIVKRIVADAEARVIFLKCLNTVLDFIALHEIGHVYADRAGAVRDFFHLETRIDAASDARVLAYFRLPGGAGAGLPRCESLTHAQVEELFCDAFALTARTIMDASGQFSMAVLNAIPERLLLLSRCFLLEDMGVMHGEGPAKQVNLGRLILANSGEPMQPISNPPHHYQSHPSALRRLDSLRCQAARIFDAFSVPGDPLAPGGDTRLVRMVHDEWNSAVLLLQDILIERLRDPALDGDDRLAQLCDIALAEQDLTAHITEGLKAFAMAAFAPYVEDHVLGQHRSAGDLSELAGRAASERLPEGSTLAALANHLCLTLLDPLRATKLSGSTNPNAYPHLRE